MENHKNIMKKFVVVGASALLVMSLGGGAVNAVHTNVHADAIGDLVERQANNDNAKENKQDEQSVLEELKKDPEDYADMKDDNPDVYKAHKDAFKRAEAITNSMTKSQIAEAEADTSGDGYNEAIAKAEKAKVEKKANDAATKKHNEDVKRDHQAHEKPAKPKPKKRTPKKRVPKKHASKKRTPKKRNDKLTPSKPSNKTRRHTHKRAKRAKRASLYKQISNLRKAIRRMKESINHIKADL